MQMQDHGRAGLHRRVKEHYEQYESDEYDEYEEVECSEAEEDEEEHEDPKPAKEEQDFLKLREKLKEKYRQQPKKQSANAFGRSSQSQDRSRTVTNDNFGSFFGPSQPAIATRVLVESRSIRETQHIMAKPPNSSASQQNKRGHVSTPTVTKKHAHDQRPHNVKNVHEMKSKAKTLKDMRDYSFLLSDDTDLPDPVKEESVLRKVPVPNTGKASARPASLNPRSVPRKASVPNLDDRPVEAPLKSKTSPMRKPARPVTNDQEKMKLASASQHVQHSKIARSKEPPPTYRSKPVLGESRKGAAGNGSGRPVGREAVRQKVAMKPPVKIMNDPIGNKKPLSAKPNSSTQNHYSDQRRVTQGSDKLKATQKQPPPSSKIQPMKPPSKQIPASGIHTERPKKRPFRRDHDDDEGDSAIDLIRKMFRYNPKKYVDDDDDSDMEVGFDSIMEEEDRSAKIARKEDEEQLRLIEEEERRERMRKKKQRR